MENVTEKKEINGGVLVPIITPVDENENVDEKAFRAVIRHCIDAGAHGIFAGGSAGMGPLLADDQWQRAMEIAKDETEGRAGLAGGVIATSTRRALEKIDILKRLDFPSMVVTPTYYISLKTEKEMLSHFSACREATDMQMITYNIPGCVQSTIPVSVIEYMAEKGWTDLIKESSGDRDYFLKVLGVCQRLSIGVMQGNEPDIEWGLRIGAAGIVPVCANYEPEAFVAAVNAATQEDFQQLSELQEHISSVREVLLLGEDKNWIAGIMYGLSTLGMGIGRPVRPIQELTEDQKKPIDRLKNFSKVY
ncbi:4-hydroxy-tetrahydrodipicolinate synthase [Sedimentisphaera cyanobacteriorum]|uniref:4-hydroxy-tetrahydrodipicolinate synthase n=1 Tax=Sedimentisphaera cyanobacteriorum TaxID=1940790 RepID=A0A1Q2HP32_9BACT|nr:dihydrodipicolinate synthase family protein [Sedimentisphaera cyanobacteriorum]AQQ09110.1 4-hydroxy-tetrahydrodipicolinate synthase [Sedimentisphaera cyanobacteriorum]